MDSVRWMLAFAAHHDWELSTFDFKTAFLNAPLEQEVYVSQVPGFEDRAFPFRCFRLMKALYGLKQSPYEWYRELSSFLVSLGMAICEADRCVFMGVWIAEQLPDIPLTPPFTDHRLNCLLHVDDGLNAHNAPPIYDWFIGKIREKYRVTDNGSASLFLSLRITRDRSQRKLWLSQSVYVEDLLEDYGLQETNPTAVPLYHQPSSLSEPPANANVPHDMDQLRPYYQKIIGSLLWLAIMTRPDISYAVIALAQFNARPERKHAFAAKGILRYLAGTRSYSLQYGGVDSSSSPSVSKLRDVVYTDADWASDQTDRKSVSGFAVFMFGGLVSWSSAKQTAVALSSTEAEYAALTHAIRHCLWLKTFTTLVGVPMGVPFPVLSDNQSSMEIAEGETISGKSKHIDIKFHFVRSHVSSGSFSLHWVPTALMIADIFTKPLGKILHGHHKSALGLVPL